VRYLREEAELLSRGTDSDEEAFFYSLFKGTLLIVGIGICAIPLARIAGLEFEPGGRRGSWPMRPPSPLGSLR